MTAEAGPVADAAVVLPELHVQGAVETVLNTPMTADEVGRASAATGRLET